MGQANQLRGLEELRCQAIKTIDPATIPYTEISDPQVSCNVPLVSVKMLTYNHAPYIAEAIEGLLRQQRDFPIELVIGEDCSSDGTREIVFDYQRRHPQIIRVITSDMNVGMIPNSLRTHRACRGKYVAYCEGDDFWHDPNKLQRQVAYLERHPNCGLVHSAVARFDEVTGRIVEKTNGRGRIQLPRAAALIEAILNESPIYTCTVVLRRTLLDEVYRDCPAEFDGRYLMRDYQTWVECAFRSAIGYIDEPLATYRIMRESASRSTDATKLIAFAKSAKDAGLHYATKYGGGAVPMLQYSIRRRFNSHLIRVGVCAGNRLIVREAFADSLQHGCKLRVAEYMCGRAACKGLLFYLAKLLFPTLWQCRRRLSRCLFRIEPYAQQ
jgi:glycosyltransferase involved in cell wall biosynthesis